MMTSHLGSLAYKSWKLTKIMPNSLNLLNHYILSNAPPKIRQWALKTRLLFIPAKKTPNMASEQFDCPITLLHFKLPQREMPIAFQKVPWRDDVVCIRVR